MGNKKKRREDREERERMAMGEEREGIGDEITGEERSSRGKGQEVLAMSDRHVTGRIEGDEKWIIGE